MSPLIPEGGIIVNIPTADFSCACLTHEGRWDEIPRSYDVLMQFITQHGRAAQTISREIYVQADFHNQEANVTEIQIGVH